MTVGCSLASLGDCLVCKMAPWVLLQPPFTVECMCLMEGGATVVGIVKAICVGFSSSAL